MHNADLDEAFAGGDTEACDWTQQTLHMMTDEVVHLAGMEGIGHFSEADLVEFMQMEGVVDTSQPLTTENSVGADVSAALENSCHPKDSVDESESESDAPEDS